MEYLEALSQERIARREARYSCFTDDGVGVSSLMNEACVTAFTDDGGEDAISSACSVEGGTDEINEPGVSQSTHLPAGLRLTSETETSVNLSSLPSTVHELRNMTVVNIKKLLS